jgi:hypothetical protein
MKKPMYIRKQERNVNLTLVNATVNSYVGSFVISSFSHKREEVAEDWRRPRNEDLRNLYASPSILTVIRLRRMEWAVNIARMGDMINVYKILVGKP